MTKTTLNAGHLCFNDLDGGDVWRHLYSPLRLTENEIWIQVQQQISKSISSQIRLQTATFLDAQLVDLRGQVLRGPDRLVRWYGGW